MTELIVGFALLLFGAVRWIAVGIVLLVLGVCILGTTKGINMKTPTPTGAESPVAVVSSFIY